MRFTLFSGAMGRICLMLTGFAFSSGVYYLFLDQKRKMKLASRIKQNSVEFDFKPENVGFSVAPNLKVDVSQNNKIMPRSSSFRSIILFII